MINNAGTNASLLGGAGSRQTAVPANAAFGSSVRAAGQVKHLMAADFGQRNDAFAGLQGQGVTTISQTNAASTSAKPLAKDVFGFVNDVLQ